ncbi:LapA family protein [Caedibacter taeniospiralis]|jgi:uncharacterized integral membrane protein|uniref:LapA family protein n=1 Tax=Caedibacter taeniospiralis TaxID=28907 RepID=UPI0037BEB1E0
MRVVGYVLLVIVFVLVCVLAVLNAQPVSFNYLLGSFNLPLILLLLLVFIVGLIVGMLLLLFSRGKRCNKIKRATPL